MQLHVVTYRAVEVYLHLFPTCVLDGCEWLGSHSGHFTPGKWPRYALDRRLSRTQNESERYGDKKYHLALPGIESLFIGILFRFLIAASTELSRLMAWFEGYFATSTHRTGWCSANSLRLYPGGAGFELLPGHLYPIFLILLSSSIAQFV